KSGPLTSVESYNAVYANRGSLPPDAVSSLKNSCTTQRRIFASLNPCPGGAKNGGRLVPTLDMGPSSPEFSGRILNCTSKTDSLLFSVVCLKLSPKSGIKSYKFCPGPVISHSKASVAC